MRAENVRIQTIKIDIFIVVVHIFKVHKVRSSDLVSCFADDTGKKKITKGRVPEPILFTSNF